MAANFFFLPVILHDLRKIQLVVHYKVLSSYRQISNISRTNSQMFVVSFAAVFMAKLEKLPVLIRIWEIQTLICKEMCKKLLVSDRRTGLSL